MTLEELERRAYANGDTKTAAILARAMDLNVELEQELASMDEKLADLERENEELCEKLDILDPERD